MFKTLRFAELAMKIYTSINKVIPSQAFQSDAWHLVEDNITQSNNRL